MARAVDLLAQAVRVPGSFYEDHSTKKLASRPAISNKLVAAIQKAFNRKGRRGIRKFAKKEKQLRFLFATFAEP